jgi:hypothetical protein
VGSNLIEAQDYFMFAIVFAPVIALLAWVVHDWQKAKSDRSDVREESLRQH